MTRRRSALHMIVRCAAHQIGAEPHSRELEACRSEEPSPDVAWNGELAPSDRGRSDVTPLDSA